MGAQSVLEVLESFMSFSQLVLQSSQDREMLRGGRETGREGEREGARGGERQGERERERETG